MYVILYVFFVNIICNYLELIALRKQISFSIFHYIRTVYLRSLLIVAIAVFFMYETSVMTLSYPFWSLLLVCSTSVAVMSVCTYFIGLNKENRAKVINYVKSKI